MIINLKCKWIYFFSCLVEELLLKTAVFGMITLNKHL